MELKHYLIRWKNLLLLLSLIPFLLLTSGCSTWEGLKRVEIKTVEVERVIPTQNHPRAVSMGDVHFYVVTEDTLDAFKERFVKEQGDFVFYAISVRDYETIALNMAELKRYIEQQQLIIIYYEKAVAPKSNN